MGKYDQERIIKQAKAKELTAKLEAVIVALGQVPEKRDPDNWDARASSEQIFLNATEYNKWRLHVSGRYPRDNDGSYCTVCEPVTRTRSDGSTYEGSDELKDQSITISIDKSVEQIAKDIKARFMPGYEKRLKLVLERIQAHNDYQATSEKTLAIAIGRKLTAAEAKEREYSFYHESGHLGEIKASDDRIDLKVSDITPEQAVRILKIIKEVKKER